MVDNAIITETTASGESLIALKPVLTFRSAYTKGERSSVKIGPQQCHIKVNIQKYNLMHQILVQIRQYNPGEKLAFCSNMAFQL